MSDTEKQGDSSYDGLKLSCLFIIVLLLSIIAFFTWQLYSVFDDLLTWIKLLPY